MKFFSLRKAFIATLALNIPLSYAGVTLTADGKTDTYALIKSKLNSEIEAPDCAHPDFGPHIRQESDATLGKPVFAFLVHVTPDNDRCLKSDRERNEIKVDANSPAGLRTVQGESMTYRWKFKLDSGFQASPYFSHLHQVKPVGGDDDMPLISFIARNSNFELSHYNSSNAHTVLKSAPLSGFKGQWVEVVQTLTAGKPGKYGVTIKRLSDGVTLLSYSSTSIDMWRSGVSYLRPKWGLYRSLQNKSYLRDEKVLFDAFCIAKGSETCGGTTTTPTPTPTPTPPPPTGTIAKIAMTGSAVTASANDGNLPVNTVDSQLSTRWAAQGDGQWIQYDLQAARMVGHVKLAWNSGNTRKARFDVQVSGDGKTFTTVYSGQSSGLTTALETYDFTDVSARYVRVVGHGNTSNTWNSITETEVYGM
jgi:hypothetical protein